VDSTTHERQWRCRGCDQLLGVESGSALRIKYKDHEVTVTDGRVCVPCRRCHRENHHEARKGHVS
jgi:hypothetical protein